MRNFLFAVSLLVSVNCIGQKDSLIELGRIYPNNIYYGEVVDDMLPHSYKGGWQPVTQPELNSRKLATDSSVIKLEQRINELEKRIRFLEYQIEWFTYPAKGQQLIFLPRRANASFNIAN